MAATIRNFLMTFLLLAWAVEQARDLANVSRACLPGDHS
jgi:hypothetical protein